MAALCDVNFKEFTKISDPIKERHKKRLAHKVSKVRMIERRRSELSISSSPILSLSASMSFPTDCANSSMGNWMST